VNDAWNDGGGGGGGSGDGGEWWCGGVVVVMLLLVCGCGIVGPCNAMSASMAGDGDGSVR
jgi:hypothetical protein